MNAQPAKKQKVKESQIIEPNLSAKKSSFGKSSEESSEESSSEESSSKEDTSFEEEESLDEERCSENESWLLEEPNDEECEIEESTKNNLHQSNSEQSDVESDMPLSIRLDNFLTDLKWTTDSMFQPTVHPFNDPTAGVQVNCSLNSTSHPIDVFKVLFSEEVMEMLCFQTNKHAEEKLNNLRLAKKLKPKSRILQFKEVYPDEMYVFHSLIILMGLIHKPSIDLYWSKDKLLETPFFRNTMTYDRFRLILSLLHFSDNDQSDDRLAKIRSVLENMIESFKAVYRPRENISIDESLIPWKGRLIFKQFNRNKRARFGIKIYKVCDWLCIRSNSLHRQRSFANLYQ